MTDKEKTLEFVNLIHKHFPREKVACTFLFIQEQIERAKSVGYIEGQNDLIPMYQASLEDKFLETYKRSVN